MERPPLIDKSFRQRPSDILCRLMRKILIIRMGFTGRENVRGIMEVIIPFSGKQRCVPVFIARVEENHVTAIFRRQVNMAVGYSRADILGYFYQHVPGGAIFNLVNSIKAQPIKLILGKPEPAAHR